MFKMRVVSYKNNFEIHIILFILQLLLMSIAKYMVDYPTLVTKDLFEIVKVQQLKTYYNTFIKPGKLVKY